MLLVRKVAAALFLAIVASSIAMLFWQMELKYTRPTPVPEGYQEVYIDDFVFVDDTLKAALDKPVFYHFFSTSCSCSKFNLDHFNALKQQYGDSLDFYVVIPAEDDIEEVRPYFEGKTKIIKDVNKRYAVASGVYATPQAVIITEDHRLYFRGNYNRARYCTDPFSNYAQMALDSLMTNTPAPKFDALAYIAYGCGINEKF